MFGKNHVQGPPTPADVSTNPEFVDAKGAKNRYSLTRSYLYVLAAEGSITSISIRRRGAKRGKRLFDCDSIRAFLKANIEPPKSAKRPNRKRGRNSK